MKTVRQLLAAKGGTVHSIGPRARVYEALRLMAEKEVGALVVLDNTGLAGILSERDYARKVILQGRSSSQTAVSEIMTGTPLTVSPETDVFDCMRLCTDSRVRHLPVLQGGAVVGVISTGDLVKAVIDAQAEQIEHLQRYITS